MEKGYDLQIDSFEEKEAKADLEGILMIIRDGLSKYHEKGSHDTNIPTSIVEDYVKRLALQIRILCNITLTPLMKNIPTVNRKLPAFTGYVSPYDCKVE